MYPQVLYAWLFFLNPWVQEPMCRWQYINPPSHSLTGHVTTSKSIWWRKTSQKNHESFYKETDNFLIRYSSGVSCQLQVWTVRVGCCRYLEVGGSSALISIHTVFLLLSCLMCMPSWTPLLYQFSSLTITLHSSQLLCVAWSVIAHLWLMDSEVLCWALV